MSATPHKLAQVEGNTTYFYVWYLLILTERTPIISTQLSTGSPGTETLISHLLGGGL